MAGPLIILYEVGIICARLFGRRPGSRRRRRSAVGAAASEIRLSAIDFGSLDLPEPSGARHPRGGLRDGHADPGGRAAAGPQGQGRGGPVADGHRQDGGLPDRRLHAAAAHARRRPAAPTAPRVLDHRADARAGRADRVRRATQLGASRRSQHPRGLRRHRLRQAARDAARRAATSSSAPRAGSSTTSSSTCGRRGKRRGARHRRGRPDVRHGLHRRPALHPAPAAAAGEAAVVPVLGDAVLPGDGADLGVHEQPHPDHDHARSRRRPSRSSRCSTTSAARRSSACCWGCCGARAATAS